MIWCRKCINLGCVQWFLKQKLYKFIIKSLFTCVLFQKYAIDKKLWFLYHKFVRVWSVGWISFHLSVFISICLNVFFINTPFVNTSDALENDYRTSDQARWPRYWYCDETISGCAGWTLDKMDDHPITHLSIRKEMRCFNSDISTPSRVVETTRITFWPYSRTSVKLF